MSKISDYINIVAGRILRIVPNSFLRFIKKPPVNKAGYELAPDANISVWFLSMSSQDFSDLPVDEGRKVIDGEAYAGAGPRIKVGKVEDLKIKGIKVRYYRPEGVTEDEKLPTLVYLHGGGWVLGSIDSHDNTSRFFCKHSNVAVLSVDYALAPENKFPAGLEDVNVVINEAMAGNIKGVDPDRIAVGGDSAGGNLSAAVSLLRAKNNEKQVKLQMLFSPVTDLSKFDTDSYKEFEDGFYLTKKQMIWYKNHYFEKPEDSFDYLASPLLASEDLLKQVAPAYMMVAGFDPLRDEGIAYGERLKKAGIPTDFNLIHTMIHPIVNTFYVWQDAMKAMVDAAAFLKENI